MKFGFFASFSNRSIYYIHIPCPKNMEYRAQHILNKLKGMLKWSQQDKDTALYQEIEVLIRYYEIILLEEESK